MNFTTPFMHFLGTQEKYRMAQVAKYASIINTNVALAGTQNSLTSRELEVSVIS